MAEIFQIPNQDIFDRNLLTAEIDKILYHDNPEVLAVWKEEAIGYFDTMKTLSRMTDNVELDLPDSLSADEKQEVCETVGKYLQQHRTRLDSGLLKTFTKVFLMFREIAECRVIHRIREVSDDNKS